MSDRIKKTRGTRGGLAKSLRASDCSTCEAREHTEWRTLGLAGVGGLDQAKACRAYPAGHAIFHQGNPCLGIYCIMEGTVALRKTDAKGRSVIVRLASAGQTLGYRAFFADCAYEASAEALTDSKVCFIESGAVRRLLEQEPSVAYNFLSRLAGDLEEAEEARLVATAFGVRARLAHLLLILKDSHGRVDSDGNIVIDLPLRRRDMAAMIGARSESLSRAIKALEDDGVTHFEGREVTVPDLDALLDEVEPHP